MLVAVCVCLPALVATRAVAATGRPAAATTCVRSPDDVGSREALAARLLAGRDAVLTSARARAPGTPGASVTSASGTAARGGAAGLPLAGTAAAVVERLRDVPVTAWSSRVLAATPGEDPAAADGGLPPAGSGGGESEGGESGGDAVPGLGVSRTADPSVTVRVRVRYRIAGDVRDTVRDRVVVASSRGGCWRLVVDRPDTSSAAVPDLWDLGPVRVERGARNVVVAATDLDEGAVRALVRDVDEAARAVDRVWGTGWRRTSVVLAPASARDAALVAGVAGEGWEQMSAFAFGPPASADRSDPAGPSGSAFGDQRLVVLPQALSSLGDRGLRFVLAHELTHEATGSAGRRDVPLWFAECFADAVAFDAVGFTAAQAEEVVGADLLGAGAGAPTRDLPAATDFDPARGDVSAAYGRADVGCATLAGDGGTPRLAEIYRTAAVAPPPALTPVLWPVLWPGPTTAPAAQVGRVVSSWRAALAAAGTDEQRLVLRWRERVAQLVRTQPRSR